LDSKFFPRRNNDKWNRFKFVWTWTWHPWWTRCNLEEKGFKK
jgi:hypothetical protein